MSSVYHDGWLRRYIPSMLRGKSFRKGIVFRGGDGGREGRLFRRYCCDGLGLAEGNSCMNRTNDKGSRAAISERSMALSKR